MNNNDKLRYFLMSDAQMKEKNEVLSKLQKEYVAGTVIVNNQRKQFSQLSKTPTIERYPDAEIIASGNIDEIVYTMPKAMKKRSN